MYGNVLLDKKGCSHWLHLLDHYREHTDVILQVHAEKLGEQRDFWSFILTIWQVLTWPITFMTGYWGMNFNNMPELEVETSPLPFAPGYKLYWFIALITYLVLTVLMIHYKIFHTAA